MYLHAVETETDVAVKPTGSQVAAAANHSYEDVTAELHFYYADVVLQMIDQFLYHTIDIQNISVLVEKLVSKNIITAKERKNIKMQKQIYDKVNSLLMKLSKKSGGKFESFLATLDEIGQQSVADVVRTALDSIDQTGQNPLKRAYGKTAAYVVTLKPHYVYTLQAIKL